ncbi:hypothetical protein [Nannocystis pusilla]|uniref:hypothetical protein n=1 Tax=Nannocystis pusilla TaxID=889268 RepID=UPI003B79754E
MRGALSLAAAPLRERPRRSPANGAQDFGDVAAAPTTTRSSRATTMLLAHFGVLAARLPAAEGRC